MKSAIIFSAPVYKKEIGTTTSLKSMSFFVGPSSTSSRINGDSSLWERSTGLRPLGPKKLKCILGPTLLVSLRLGA